jgi:hypothetical protein
MTISIVSVVGTDTGESNYSASGTVTQSANITTAIGDVIFVHHFYAGGSGAISCTLSGGTGSYTTGTTQESQFGNVAAEHFYRIASAAETFKVTATLLSSAANRKIVVAVLRSSNGSMSFHSSSSFKQSIDTPANPGTNTASSQSVPNNSIIIFGAQLAQTAITGAGSGYTASANGSDTGFAIYQLNASATSTSPVFTTDASAYRALIGGFVFTEPATPNPPTGVTAGSITAFSATASWTDDSSNETGFKVQYAPAPYSSWTAFSGSPAAANATTLATGNVLTEGTSYKIRVASTNASGDSAFVESGVFTTTALTRLRPNATTTAGAWTAVGAATLFGAMNEVTPSDAEYITTSSLTTGKFKVEVSTDPGDDNNHSVSIRARKTSGTLTVSLVQGDPSETLIKSWVVGATASFATYILTMTSGEASAITDYSNLYLKCVTT